MADNNQNQFRCTGNCLNCPPGQRAYCAAQHSYSNMKVLDRIMEELLGIKAKQLQMADIVEAMQNNEAHIFNPEEDEEVQQAPAPAPTPRPIPPIAQ